jgi:glycosyltransferase involved in cell wall biosynthesis
LKAASYAGILVAMQKPRISLICVVLNVAKYIDETIRNVQAQTSREWELILIDGASTDGTPDIIAKYAKEDSRIRWKSEPDEGPWDATEKGVAMSQGEYMMIVGGQDGFLDNEWLQKCLDAFDADPSLSMVWAATRAMHEDGTLFPEENVSYSHFTGQEGKLGAFWQILRKGLKVLRDFLFGSAVRRKVLWNKIFSPSVGMKLNFYTHRRFPGGTAPQKEEWFRYWLETGVPFNEQPMCVSKEVYLACVAKYPRGSSIIMNHIMDFHYNFNAKGYLAWYIPVVAAYGRAHGDNSGARIPEELGRTMESYMNKIIALRKQKLDNHEEMVFVDSHGKEVSRRRF